MIREVANSLARLVGWLVLAWHSRVVLPSVALWESWSAQAEASITAVIREWFGLAYKLINGAGAWVLSIVDAGQEQRRALQRQHQEAWARWWREDRTSTLNAVVANAHARESLDGFSQSASASGSVQRAPAAPGAAGAGADGGAGTPRAGSGERAWPLSGLLRLRRPSDGGAAAASPKAPRAQQQAGGQQQQQQQPPAGARPTAPGRPGRGQPVAASPLSRLAGLGAARQWEERASVFHDAAGWWGVHEVLNRTGLLEDIRLSLEMAVSAAFESLRKIVRLITLSRRAGAGGGGGGGGGGGAPSPRRGAEPPPRPRRGGASADPVQPPPPLQLRRRVRPSAPGSVGGEDGLAELRGPGAASDPGQPAGALLGAQASPTPEGAAGGRRRVRMSAEAMAAPPTSPGRGGARRPEQESWQPDRGGSDGGGGGGKGATDARGALPAAAAAAASAAAVSAAPGKLRKLIPWPRLRGEAAGSGPLSDGSGSCGSPAAAGGAGAAAGEGQSPRRGAAARMRLRSKSFAGLERLADESHAGRPMTKLRRTRSVGRFDHTPWAVPWEDGAGPEGEWESPTAHVIRMAGYPLMTYTVVTEDGYVLRMERIPRPGAPDVALFMHGVLDTSLTWVSSGVTGSQAFAAWDQGFDVFLGSSRSNPPRVATSPSHQGMGYWRYTLNELGIFDVAAQIDKVHEIKMQELGGRDPRHDLRYAGDLAGWTGGGAPPRPRNSSPFNAPAAAAAAAAAGGAPSGEALFFGQGVGGAPAGLPRLRMQRSLSDHALAPGAPPGAQPQPGALSGALSGSLPGAPPGAAGAPASAAAAALAEGPLAGAAAGGAKAQAGEGGWGGGVGAWIRRAAPRWSSPGPSGGGGDDNDGGGGGAGSNSSDGVPAAGAGAPPAAPAEAEAGGGGGGGGAGAREEWGARLPSMAAASALAGRVVQGAVALGSSIGSGIARGASLQHAGGGAGDGDGDTNGPEAAKSAARGVGAAYSGPATPSEPATPELRERLPAAGGGAGAQEQAQQAQQGHIAPGLVQQRQDEQQQREGVESDGQPQRWRQQQQQQQHCEVRGEGLGGEEDGGGGAGGPRIRGAQEGRCQVLRIEGRGEQQQQQGEGAPAGADAPGPSSPFAAPGVQGASGGAGSGGGAGAGPAQRAALPQGAGGAQGGQGRAAPLLYGPDGIEGGGGGAVEAAATSAVAAAGTVVAGVVIGTAAVAEATMQAASSLANALGLGGGGGSSSSGSGSSAPLGPSLEQVCLGEADRSRRDLPQAQLPPRPETSLGFAGPSRSSSGGGSGGGGGAAAAAPRAGLGASPAAPGGTMRRARSSQAMFSLARSPDGSSLSLRGMGGGGGNGSALSLDALGGWPDGGGAHGGAHSAVGGKQQAGALGEAAGSGGGGGVGPQPACSSPAAMEGGGDAFHFPTPPRSAPAAGGASRRAGARGASAAAGAAGGGCEPYNLRVVAHSLGGASMLIYLVMRLRSGRPHRVKRLVLLTPAGFHETVPWVFYPVIQIIPPVLRLMRLLLGEGAAAALYLPTSAARLLTFKFMLDFARLPALGDLLRAFMRFSLNGDRSQWDRAVQLPHYNARAMPAVSLHQGMHFVQLYRGRRFCLYDYGGAAANLAHYGHAAPPDIASEYWRLDMPVDICAGVHDGVIPPANVRRHVSAMRSAGVDVTYREFNYGHMDFTFNSKDELRYFVLSRLRKRGTGR